MQQSSSKTASGHSVFALKLYRLLAGQQNKNMNLVFSPISIYGALTMLLYGASNDTYGELAKGMEVDPTVSKNPDALSDLLQSVIKDNTLLSMANRAYVEKSYNVLPKYIDDLKSHLQTECVMSDFAKNSESVREEINRFVREKTNGKISGLFGPSSLNQFTRLVLVNALHFKAEWISPFKRELTCKHDFNVMPGKKVKVDMMSKVGGFGVYDRPDCTIVHLPFDNGKIDNKEMFMLAIRSNKMHDIDGVMQKLSNDDWIKLLNHKFQGRQVTLLFPKANLSFSASLEQSNILPKLGIKRIFDLSKAQFDKIVPKNQLCVNTIAHKAKLEWDEKGAEGAAATGCDTVDGAGQQIIFDHPFAVIVVLEQCGGNVPVFVGKVSDPTKLD